MSIVPYLESFVPSDLNRNFTLSSQGGRSMADHVAEEVKIFGFDRKNSPELNESLKGRFYHEVMHVVLDFAIRKFEKENGYSPFPFKMPHNGTAQSELLMHALELMFFKKIGVQTVLTERYDFMSNYVDMVIRAEAESIMPENDGNDHTVKNWVTDVHTYRYLREVVNAHPHPISLFEAYVSSDRPPEKGCPLGTESHTKWGEPLPDIKPMTKELVRKLLEYAEGGIDALAKRFHEEPNCYYSNKQIISAASEMLKKVRTKSLIDVMLGDGKEVNLVEPQVSTPAEGTIKHPEFVL